jgi:branched-subunit amino acid ABC-type transport system permease component
VHDNIQLIIVGLGSGATYAVLAVGLVVIFRGSGVLNFAQGAIATVSAYTFLRLAGEHDVNKALSAVIAVAVAGLIGAVFEYLVMRKLVNAPALARVVATLGLLVGLIAAVPLVFSDAIRPTVPIFPNSIARLPIGSPNYFIPYDRLWLVVISVGLTGVVWAVYRFTNFGKVTRAVSENVRAVSTLGYSPQRIALANWVIGSLLAGVAGVLLAGLVVQSETMLTEILMAGLAAALIGGFRSFGVTLVAAYGLSALQTLLIRYSPNLTSSTTIVGWGDLAPFLVILVFMIVRGAPIPLRGAMLETRLPTVPLIKRPLRSATVVFLIGVLLYLVVDKGTADALTVTLIGGLVCTSLVVVIGFLGQVSVIQMALAGLGAFWGAKAATDWGLPFPLPILVGGLIVVPSGVLVALPALRVRGINLAVLTISLAFALDAAFFTDVRLSDGAKYPPASVFGLDASGIRDPKTFGIIVLVISVAVGIGVAYLRRGILGKTFLALRANERGAAGLGMSLTWTKLVGFAIGSFIAGIAGTLYGYRSETLSYGTFAAFSSLLIVAFAYLGGIGSLVGALIGGASLSGGIISHILNFQGDAARVMQVIGGVGVMMTVVLHPDGLALLPRDFRERWRRRRRRAPGEGDVAPAESPTRGDALVVGKANRTMVASAAKGPAHQGTTHLPSAEVGEA